MSRSKVFMIVAVGAAFFAVSCGNTKKTVGIAKFVAHPALDAVEQGIIDEISESKPEIELDRQNSNADMATAGQIAQRFKQAKVAVAVGIATPTAQALVNQIKDRPVVYSVVTDPVSAGLVESMDRGART
jgi:putative ABC transport system substrate-binding protein